VSAAYQKLRRFGTAMLSRQHGVFQGRVDSEIISATTDGRQIVVSV
jgi:hypothetical protein